MAVRQPNFTYAQQLLSYRRRSRTYESDRGPYVSRCLRVALQHTFPKPYCTSELPLWPRMRRQVADAADPQQVAEALPAAHLSDR